MVTEPLVVDDEGYVHPTDEPGLGAELNEEIIVEAAEGYCDICWLGDDFASQTSMMISPALWRKFIRPFLAEQVQLVREHGLYVLYHSCGAVRPVLNDLIDIGVNGLLVYQTTATAMDVASIAREFGGRLVFYGGIDVQQLLSFGTVDDVKRTVEANVLAFADCGGYVVANSHTSVATIRPENIQAMCEAAREVAFGSGEL
jgi:uroporphyrinogen decarboxylase